MSKGRIDYCSVPREYVRSEYLLRYTIRKRAHLPRVRGRGQEYLPGRSGIFVVFWEKITGIFAERLKNICCVHGKYREYWPEYWLRGSVILAERTRNTG